MGGASELVGKTYASRARTLTAEGCEAYARACDDGNPSYFGPAAVAPPLIVVTASIPDAIAPVLSDPAVLPDPKRVLHLVHGEEDIRWYRPLAPGEILHTHGVLENIKHKSSGEIIVVGAHIHNAALEPVAEVHSSLFIRDAARAGGAREAVAESLPKPTWQARWRVAADQSLRYAEASGDRNPIHTDDAIAQQAGLRGRILHGLCTMAFACRSVVDLLLAGDPARLLRLRVRFSRPVYMGDELTWLAWPGAAGTPNREIGFEVHNQQGQPVLKHGLAELAGE